MKKLQGPEPAHSVAAIPVFCEDLEVDFLQG